MSLLLRHRISVWGALTLSIILFSLTVCHAQSMNGRNTTGTYGNEEINGTIHFPAGHKTGYQPIVKLHSDSSSSELTALASPDGTFSFTSLRPDSYTVIVNGGAEYENARETVAIGNSGPVPAQGNPSQYAHPMVYKVDIYLRPKRANVADARAAATQAALARVSAPVREIFSKAMESVHQGNSAQAIDQLKAAIQQAPNFALAYTEMGLQYLKLGKADKAAESFASALKIDSEDFDARLNYGFALLNLRQFSPAEEQLRLALRTEPASPNGHYYLALALINQRRYEPAEQEFKTAITNSNDAIAAAHKYLGGIYWDQKQFGPAADELSRYLTMEPNAPDAARIRATVKELQAKRKPQA